ncbi:MAG: diguanylate cyclase [Selenomonadaceae bacterium]
METYENKINHKETCCKLLMERLHAIMYEYDVVNDIMVFSSMKDGGRERRIEDYRRKLSTEDRGAVHPDFFENLLALLMGQNVVAHEFLLDLSEPPQGRFSWYEVVGKAIFDPEGRVTQTVGVFWDITDQKNEIAEFSPFRSEQDPLTGLLNSAGARKAIEDHIAGEWGMQSNALLMLDIKNVMQMNKDMDEKAIDDYVLMRIGCKLKKFFRTTDILAYTESGRFIIFMKDIANDTIVSRKVDMLQKIFSDTDLAFCVPQFSCRIGTAIYPVEGRSYEELIGTVLTKHMIKSD